MDTSQTALLGIISSLVATFLFLALRQIIINIIIPWFRRQIYRGVKIEGVWETEMSDNIKYTFHLKQDADSINGIFTHSQSTDHDINSLSYSISGFCRDGFFVGTAEPSAQDAIDHQAFLFAIIHREQSLYIVGKTLTVDSGKISSSNEVEFRKI
jgi:hypothetical protein